MDWNEVKAKPKKAKKPKQNQDEYQQYGGTSSGGGLRAGPVKGVGQSKPAVNKQAQNIADFDYLRDEDEEIKYETISHDCGAAVQRARLAKEMTQAQLAKAINEKPGVIHDIENGTAAYDANIINSIEQVLGVKIPRGRKQKRSKPTQGGWGF